MTGGEKFAKKIPNQKLILYDARIKVKERMQQIFLHKKLKSVS